MYGTKLLAFDPLTRTADLYNVLDVTKSLENWTPVGPSTKHVDNVSDDWLAKLEALWVYNGKVSCN